MAECEKPPAEKLSKGMKSRLRLARAFLINPSVLFLDEPTSGLDPATMESIHSIILEKKHQAKQLGNKDKNGCRITGKFRFVR